MARQNPEVSTPEAAPTPQPAPAAPPESSTDPAPQPEPEPAGQTDPQLPQREVGAVVGGACPTCGGELLVSEQPDGGIASSCPTCHPTEKAGAEGQRELGS